MVLASASEVRRGALACVESCCPLRAAARHKMRESSAVVSLIVSQQWREALRPEVVEIEHLGGGGGAQCTVCRVPWEDTIR